MQTVLGYVARAKAELQKATRGIKFQLAEEINATLQHGRMMMRLSGKRSVARTVYEEVRFVHANRVKSILWQMAKHSIQLPPALA